MSVFDIDDASTLGCVIVGPEGYPSYIPYDFTSVNFYFSPALLIKTTKATGLLGKLDGYAGQLAWVEQFTPMFIHTEAVWSRQLSGIKDNQIDSLLYLLQPRGNKQNDKGSILHLMNALDAGLEKLKTTPISNEFICWIYELLAADNSAAFRIHQNWLGGNDVRTAYFVPPPPYEVNRAMNELKKFILRSDDILPLLKVGLVYAQLETIRPFMSYNSRIGRLLLCFHLATEQLLSNPLLCLSRHFYLERQAYYDSLRAYYQGDYGTWLDFFLEKVLAASEKSLTMMDRLNHIRQEDLKRLSELTKTASHHGSHLLSHLFKLPVTDVTQVMKCLNVSRPAAQAIINRLIKLNILYNRDESLKYARSYIYSRCFAVFE